MTNNRAEPQADSERYYHPIDVSRALGITVRTVVRQCRDGRLAAVRLGKLWRIREGGTNGLRATLRIGPDDPMPCRPVNEDEGVSR